MQLRRFKIIFLLVLALMSGTITWWSTQVLDVAVITGWLTFGLTYMISSLITISTVKSTQIVKRASIEDMGVLLQFVLLLLTCSFALIAIIFWRSDFMSLGKHHIMDEVLFVLSVTLSWLVLHTSFLFRYAHMYYGDENEKYVRHKRGLDFPDDEHPDYFDFAYYSFTIGMTFQVSDVVIKSKGIRRLTLIHSMISFLFNTILVAITINELISL